MQVLMVDYGSYAGQAVVHSRRPYVVKGVGTIPAFVWFLIRGPVDGGWELMT
jgi:hypothetical protein